MTILFTTGINDQCTVEVMGVSERGRFLYNLGGSTHVLPNLSLDQGEVSTVLFLGEGIPQPTLEIPRNVTLVFNQITEPDTHRKALERCRVLCERLNGVPVINHPDAVLNNTRDRASELLQGIPDLKMPRTIRRQPASPEQAVEIIDAELGWPALIREPGFHNALTTVRIDGPDEADKLHGFAFDGSDFYLTEFVDYSDEQGVYYTQRIVMIGGEPYLRHMFYGGHWLVNSDSREFMWSHPEIGDPVELTARLEAERLPRARAALEEVARRLGLEYFGIDCSIREDGHVLVFEANASMNILADFPNAIHEARLAPVRQRLEDYIRQRARQVS